MSKFDEQVLCKKVENYKNFIPTMKFLQQTENYSWQTRGTCETNLHYKQIIPYVILYDAVKEKYLTYYRKAGDGRLLGSLSIGVGGHINPCDAHNKVIHSIHPIVIKNINRELGEELGSRYKPIWNWWWFFRGFIYDSSTEVGKVHVGLVFLKHIDLDESWKFEDDEHKFSLMSYNEIRTNYSNLENWSQIAFDTLIQRQINLGFFKGNYYAF